MRRTFIAAALWAFAFMPMMASVDPNFYIYLCFGQSNMEGNAQWESVDTQNVDERFQMLATTNFSSPVRHMGEWYVAKPPIVSPQGKLGMAEYFGRTMVAALPAEVLKYTSSSLPRIPVATHASKSSLSPRGDTPSSSASGKSSLEPPASSIAWKTPRSSAANSTALP